jgi:hypothetical protein
MDPLDQAVDAPQVPQRPYAGAGPTQRGSKGSSAYVGHDKAGKSGQTIKSSPPVLHRYNSGDDPAAVMAQPNGLASAAVPLTADAILARLEQHARHAQGALSPETERALRKASVAFSGWATAQGFGGLQRLGHGSRLGCAPRRT